MKKQQKRPPTGSGSDAFKQRIAWVEERTGVSIDPEEKKWGAEVKGVIENSIGFIKVPLAIAGPLHIEGSFAKGEFLVPLCTVEGTLSASLARGAYLTTLSGGIRTKHLRQVMTRTPVFHFSSFEEVSRFEQWILEHKEQIQQEAEKGTRHGRLIDISMHFMGRFVIVEFAYDTKEAAGQNMTTIATSLACQWIKATYPSQTPFDYLIESNFNGDKNVSFHTLVKGRGHAVTAEAVIPNQLIKKFSRASAKQCVWGSNIGSVASQMAGIPQYNLHTANALTAIYLATGQDVACVVENAMNTLHVEELDNSDLYVSLHMPSITIGTIGGGTKLEDQQKNLAIMGCLGENSSKKMAEVIAGACLALEISLGTAITSNEFVEAHLKYSRGQ